MSTYSFVGDLKFGCSPAAGCGRLMEARWESFKEARRACTGAVVSLSLVQYSCSVKVRLYSKVCFITGCTLVLVLVPRVLSALETSYISYPSVVAL